MQCACEEEKGPWSAEHLHGSLHPGEHGAIKKGHNMHAALQLNEELLAAYQTAVRSASGAALAFI